MSCGGEQDSNFDSNMDSFRTNGNQCIAQNSDNSKSIRAIGLCCRMPTNTQAPTSKPTTPPTHSSFCMQIILCLYI